MMIIISSGCVKEFERLCTFVSALLAAARCFTKTTCPIACVMMMTDRLKFVGAKILSAYVRTDEVWSQGHACYHPLLLIGMYRYASGQIHYLPKEKIIFHRTNCLCIVVVVLLSGSTTSENITFMLCCATKSTSVNDLPPYVFVLWRIRMEMSDSLIC